MFILCTQLGNPMVSTMYYWISTSVVIMILLLVLLVTVQESKSMYLVAQENATVAVQKNAKPISDRL